VTGALGSPAVVLVNGGRAELLPGTWSATLEWLVGRLAPVLPGLAFLEVKYRTRSWNRLEECADDARRALERAGDVPVALFGFSMGGAVAALVARDPRVRGVVTLAPWLPDRLPVDALAGRRLSVVHGTLDRNLPFLPGVSPTLSRRGYERALAAGAEPGPYRLVRGGLHAAAVRARSGRVVALPGATAYARFVQAELQRFAAAASTP
jgi:dienelactone hydrolase